MLHQVIQRVEHLFDRGCRVKTVELIQIDMIELQTAQALFDATDDVIARTAAGVHPGRARFAKHFGGNHHVFARNFQVLQRLAGDLLRAPFRIHIRGIDEINSGIQCTAHQLLGFTLLQLTNLAPHAAFSAEGHGAKAQFRHKQTGIAQFLITHKIILACRSMGTR